MWSLTAWARIWQVAGVGLSEEEAIAKGLRYVKGVNPYAKSAMGDARVSDHGFAKLLIEVGLAPQHGPVVGPPVARRPRELEARGGRNRDALVRAAARAVECRVRLPLAAGRHAPDHRLRDRRVRLAAAAVVRRSVCLGSGRSFGRARGRRSR